jgi:hypothetical protein
MNALLAERPESPAAHGHALTARPGTPSDRDPDRADFLRRLVRDSWPMPLSAAILCVITFLASGGLNLGAMTTVEMGLTIGCGIAIAAIVAIAPGG